VVLPRGKLPQDWEEDVGMLTRFSLPLDALDVHPEDLVAYGSERSFPHPILEHSAHPDNPIESPNSETDIQPVLVSPVILKSIVEVIPSTGEGEYGKDDVNDEEDLVR
jgi:hypothetical protein